MCLCEIYQATKLAAGSMLCHRSTKEHQTVSLMTVCVRGCRDHRIKQLPLHEISQLGRKVIQGHTHVHSP